MIHAAVVGAAPVRAISSPPPKPAVAETPPPAVAESPASDASQSIQQPKKRAVAKPKPTSLYKDGEFAGNPVDIEYGLVQISAIIRDGRIAGIKWLQDPEDIDLSKQINQDAMPKLTREAIAAQKAQVDIVTGATFTVLGFRLSLSTALAQATGGNSVP
jgi:uncharacterized protein with FMN-binding domain